MGWALRSRKQRDWLTALGLVALVFIEWGLAYHLFSDRKWSDPLSYWGDAQFSAAVVASAARGEYLPFLSKELPSLGAPFVASWNDFPMTEEVLYFLVGTVARFTGVFLAINLGLVLASMLAALSFFFVARRFHLSRPYSFMGGVLFGLAPYIFYRGVHHYSLSFYFVIPWQVLVCAWLASRKGVAFGTRRFTVSALVLVGSAWSMVYFYFFGLQLWALGFVTHLIRRGKQAQSRAALALFGLALVAGLLVNLDSLLWVVKHGPNGAAVVRSRNDVEQYALKTIDMLMPGGHHRFAAGRVAATQVAATRVTSGEAPSPYLGVLGGLSLLSLLGYGFVSLVRRRVDLPATWALMVVWLIVFHTVGGGNSLFGVFGATMLRSVNRVSILVFVYALLFAAWALPRWLSRVPTPARWGLAVTLAILGSWEAIPMDATPDSVAHDHRLAEADRQLVTQAEAALPPGARVFQLPPMHFPESPAAGLEAYELFRPYFFSKHLVYSFGDVKGRPNANWKFEVAARPLPELFAELKRQGFSAVYVNFKAYGGPGVLDQLKGAGGTVIAVSQAQDSAFLRLP